jgi:MFS family permease
VSHLTEHQPIDWRTSRSGSVASVVVVAAALVLAALPLFMVGGLAVQVKNEFGLTESSLGAAVTIGFVFGAVVAPLGGRLADRIGPRTTTYVGASLSGLSLIGLGAATTGWGTLVAFLCLAGLAVAVTDPGLAILVNRTIPMSRQGLAFGIKEASIPAATLAAGIAVPAIALTAGWRWAFAIGLLPFAIVLTLLPRLDIRLRSSDLHRGEGDGGPNPPARAALMLAAVAAAMGTAAASGVGIFLTDSAVTMGMSEANAGFLLAVGSVAGIITRVAAGAMADRIGGPQFKLIAIMLAVGAATMALGGTGNTTLLIIGTLGAFTGGWAWTGIFFLSLVKTNPARAGSVAGIGMAGLGVGNASGPLLFGITAQSFSFGAAWLGAAVVAGLAAVLMAMARSRF